MQNNHCPIQNNYYIRNNHCPKTPPYVSTQYKIQSFSGNAQSWSTSASQPGKSFFFCQDISWSCGEQQWLRWAWWATCRRVPQWHPRLQPSHQPRTGPSLWTCRRRCPWGTGCGEERCKTKHTHAHTQHAHTTHTQHTHMHTHAHTHICQCSQYAHTYPNIEQWANQQAFIGDYITCCS